MLLGRVSLLLFFVSGFHVHSEIPSSLYNCIHSSGTFQMPVGSCSARVSSLARFLFVHSKQSESATIIGVRCRSGMFIGCCACNVKCNPLLSYKVSHRLPRSWGSFCWVGTAASSSGFETPFSTLIIIIMHFSIVHDPKPNLGCNAPYKKVQKKCINTYNGQNKKVSPSSKFVHSQHS